MIKKHSLNMDRKHGKGEEDMTSKELKKILAGLCFTAFLTGMTLIGIGILMLTKTGILNGGKDLRMHPENCRHCKPLH